MPTLNIKIVVDKILPLIKQASSLLFQSTSTHQTKVLIDRKLQNLSSELERFLNFYHNYNKQLDIEKLKRIVEGFPDCFVDGMHPHPAHLAIFARIQAYFYFAQSFEEVIKELFNKFSQGESFSQAEVNFLSNILSRVNGNTLRNASSEILVVVGAFSLDLRSTIFDAPPKLGADKYYFIEASNLLSQLLTAIKQDISEIDQPYLFSKVISFLEPKSQLNVGDQRILNIAMQLREKIYQQPTLVPEVEEKLENFEDMLCASIQAGRMSLTEILQLPGIHANGLDTKIIKASFINKTSAYEVLKTFEKLSAANQTAIFLENASFFLEAKTLLEFDKPLGIGDQALFIETMKLRDKAYQQQSLTIATTEALSEFENVLCDKIIENKIFSVHQSEAEKLCRNFLKSFQDYKSHLIEEKTKLKPADVARTLIDEKIKTIDEMRRPLLAIHQSAEQRLKKFEELLTDETMQEKIAVHRDNKFKRFFVSCWEKISKFFKRDKVVADPEVVSEQTIVQDSESDRCVTAQSQDVLSDWDVADEERDFDDFEDEIEQDFIQYDEPENHVVVATAKEVKSSVVNSSSFWQASKGQRFLEENLQLLRNHTATTQRMAR